MDNVLVKKCPACLSPDLFPYKNVKDFRVSGESFELVRCPQCGLVVTQLHPGMSGIGRYYETEDYISHSDSGTSLMDKVYYFVRRWMAGSKRRLVEKFAPDKSLIDLGAGTGFFLAHMQAHGWQVRGMEPGIEARRVALQSHGITLEEPEKLLEIPDRSVGCVTMWHVLEHVHEPEKYLAHIRRVLNDDGVLILALPNYRSLDQKCYGAYWGAWDVPRHLWHFSPRSVEAFLKRIGFYMVERHMMPFDSFYVALIGERYKGGGLFRMIRGIAIGKLSFFRALFNASSASSVIYVFKKTGNTR